MSAGPANVTRKLRGQGPRCYGSAARRPLRLTKAGATCGRRDAALVLFDRGASAPGQSRAAPAWRV